MRLRLTLWFVFALVVVIAAGAALFYAVLSQQLRSDLQALLVQQVARYEREVSSARDEGSLIFATRDYLASQRAEPLRRNGLVLSLATRNGTVVSSSEEVRPEELPEAAALLASGEPFVDDAKLVGGHYRVLGTVVYSGGERLGAVFIAGSLEEIDSTLRRLLVLLGISGLLGCGVVGFGAWFLLGRALRPVVQITRTAAAISREDLSKRIDYSGPDDEIGELARTMDAMLDRLQSAFAAQEQFVSDVSHELRTPITIAKGHLQVLARTTDPSPELVRQEQALVIDELDRMDRLVNDLLTLARAGRPGLLRKEKIDLNLFLQSLKEQAKYLGDRNWQIDCLPGGSAQADQDRLTQVFLNLLQNAVVHTRQGETIALGGEWERTGASADLGDAPGDTVRLWVRDEGEGMAEEVRQRVFERFYRGESSAGGGRVGLGLAIAQALVKAHGGSIEVESSPGRGAKFTVRLPAVDREDKR